MLSCSLDVWPATFSLADDLNLPILFDFCPFDTDFNVEKVEEAPLVCNVCNAYGTPAFQRNNGNIICPFCQNSGVSDESSIIGLNEFRIEREIPKMSFYLCLLLDNTCPEDMFEAAKIYMFTALRALLPGTQFIVGIVANNLLVTITFRSSKSLIMALSF